MKQLFIIHIALLCFCIGKSHAQEVTEHGTITFGTVYNGDTIPLIVLPTVHIVEAMSAEGLENYKK